MTSIESWVLSNLNLTGALCHGHFLLSSGLHSLQYVQCAKLLQHPGLAHEVGRNLAWKVTFPVTHVIGPAMGGIILAHTVGYHLGVPVMFTERVNGEMTLRRGFELPQGSKVLICEDVVSTGLSANEVRKLVAEAKAETVGVVSIINRAKTDNVFGNLPWHWLLKIDIDTYTKENCPACLENREAPQKPGSRV